LLGVDDGGDAIDFAVVAEGARKMDPSCPGFIVSGVTTALDDDAPRYLALEIWGGEEALKLLSVVVVVAVVVVVVAGVIIEDVVVGGGSLEVVFSMPRLWVTPPRDDDNDGVPPLTGCGRLR
jgi:hypothetical protein